jgi:hypothetical protein
MRWCALLVLDSDQDLRSVDALQPIERERFVDDKQRSVLHHRRDLVPEQAARSEPNTRGRRLLFEIGACLAVRTNRAHHLVRVGVQAPCFPHQIRLPTHLLPGPVGIFLVSTAPNPNTDGRPYPLGQFISEGDSAGEIDNFASFPCELSRLGHRLR